jgi:hypothetical protein
MGGPPGFGHGFVFTDRRALANAAHVIADRIALS